MTRRAVVRLLLAVVTLVTVVALLRHGPIPQDPAYHAFADTRRIAGIPNFWNVVSNLPFLLAGLYGLARRSRLAVDATRAQGYVVDSDTQRTLLVSAARKICERRENHSTVAQRRATALSSQELSTVTDTFAGNARSFTTLALETYCAA